MTTVHRKKYSSLYLDQRTRHTDTLSKEHVMKTKLTHFCEKRRHKNDNIEEFQTKFSGTCQI